LPARRESTRLSSFFGWNGFRTIALSKDNTEKENDMLSWAITFLVVALIAALFGFGGIASASAGIAQILFFVFIVLFVIALVANAMRGRAPRL
jgi:uncharacterized membrane protein YtjA (UPF0391 family)